MSDDKKKPKTVQDQVADAIRLHMSAWNGNGISVHNETVQRTELTVVVEVIRTVRIYPRAE